MAVSRPIGISSFPSVPLFEGEQRVKPNREGVRRVRPAVDLKPPPSFRSERAYTYVHGSRMFSHICSAARRALLKSRSLTCNLSGGVSTPTGAGVTRPLGPSPHKRVCPEETHMRLSFRMCTFSRSCRLRLRTFLAIRDTFLEKMAHFLIRCVARCIHSLLHVL